MEKPTASAAVTALLTELMADPDGMTAFSEVVASSFSGKKSAYNIDALGRFVAAIESNQYASAHMIGTRRFADRLSLLEFAVKNAVLNGPIVEFGVWSGRTINHIARLKPSSKIYGFDSFEGLPEGWFDKTKGKGQFSLEGRPPPNVSENIELIVGWFDRTLPDFVDTHNLSEISLLHIDCDIYYSTQTVLNILKDKIVPGTIIVFDEYFNYFTWRRHEFKAFQEFVSFRQLKYEYIGLVPTGEQVAVRILSSNL